MGEVAEAIRCATARFVQRMPALQQLCFSDGTPFVDVQTQAWITGADQAQTTGSPVQEYAGLRDELTTQLNTEGVEVVLLDNMDIPTLQEAVRRNAGRAILEISGGVNLQTVRALAETGVDRISIGALTKDVKAIDFSMRMEQLT